MKHPFGYPKLAGAGAIVVMLVACGGTASVATAPSTPPSPPSSVAAASAKPAAPASVAAASAKPAAPASVAAASAKPAAPASVAAASASTAAAAEAYKTFKPVDLDALAAMLPKPEMTTVRLGNAAHQADSFATEYANEEGIYQKFGFQKVTSTYFDGDGPGRQALLASQVDIMAGSPGSAVVSLTTDSHILQLGMFIDRSTDVLVSVPSVKTVADIKGKKIGISTFGGDSHASVLLALKALGVNPSDVTIVQVGGDLKRIATLKAGTIQAVPVEFTEEKDLNDLGFNSLVHLKDANVHLARESIMVRADWAQKYPNTVLDLVAANMAALHDMGADPRKAVPGYFKWIGTGTMELAQSQINTYLPLALWNMESPQDAWDNMKEVMSSADARIASVNLNDAHTDQFLSKLKSIGFEKAVGVPGA